MKKALIFQGGWEGHDPLLVARVMESLLINEGFSVDFKDNLDCLAQGDWLKTFDLIVPVWTMGEINGDFVKNIATAVEEGTGLAGCHGGMCDAFRNDTLWQFLTGAQWVAHPGNDGTSFTVQLAKDDYFTKGLSDFTITSEHYYLHIDPAVRVYATTQFPVAEGPHTVNGTVDMPVIFTKKWGKGKVFYNALGHRADVFDVEEARELMRRGLIWAAR